MLRVRESPQRKKKDLLAATRPFASEDVARSWWSVGSTLCILAAVFVLAAILPWWPVRLIVSFVGGLLLVRTFILYHDFMHGSLLRRSRLARWLFYPCGLVMLTPPRYWRYSHNFHHSHVGKPIPPGHGSVPLVTWDVGSFPLMTTEQWRNATTMQRVRYRINRHPLTLLFAYFTVFMFSLCIAPLVSNPRKYWDGALSLVVHGGIVAGLWIVAGFPVLFFSFLLPLAIATAVGAYLFYAQHNYEGMLVLPRSEWTYYRGATESSSYMKLGPIMHWFTGNIGYHHVHHMNPLIPFYRLPEAMAAVPELQSPQVTSLHPRDILACLRLNLWDPQTKRLVGYHAAST